MEDSSKGSIYKVTMDGVTGYFIAQSKSTLAYLPYFSLALIGKEVESLPVEIEEVPFSEETLDKVAETYASELSSCYYNDYQGFLNGFRAAVTLLGFIPAQDNSVGTSTT
jgi:hypothetical protein